VASSPKNIDIRNVIDLYGPTTNIMQLDLQTVFAICKLRVMQRWNHLRKRNL